MTSPSPENLQTVFQFLFRGFDALGYAEHEDYEVVQSTNPDFNKAVVRVNIFHDHRQTVQVGGRGGGGGGGGGGGRDLGCRPCQHFPRPPPDRARGGGGREEGGREGEREGRGGGRDLGHLLRQHLPRPPPDHAGGGEGGMGGGGGGGGGRGRERRREEGERKVDGE